MTKVIGVPQMDTVPTNMSRLTALSHLDVSKVSYRHKTPSGLPEMRLPRRLPRLATLRVLEMTSPSCPPVVREIFRILQ